MKRAALLVVGIAGIAALLLGGCGRGISVPGVPSTVATVNGDNISASSYLDQLNRMAGKQVLRQMMEQAVVLQWAKDEKVAPTEDQIKKQADRLKSDGSYDQQVKILGKEGMKSQLEVQQAVINLCRKFYTFSDADLKAIYDQPSIRARFVHGPRKRVAIIVNSDRGKLEEAAKQAKSGKDFDDVGNEYSTSPNGMAGAIPLGWIDPDHPNLPTVPAPLVSALANATKETKVGDVSKVLMLSKPGQPSLFGLLKVLEEEPKENKNFQQAKDELTDMAALQKAQSDTDFQRRLNDQKKDAKIEVNIPEFRGSCSELQESPAAEPDDGRHEAWPGA